MTKSQSKKVEDGFYWIRYADGADWEICQIRGDVARFTDTTKCYTSEIFEIGEKITPPSK